MAQFMRTERACRSNISFLPKYTLNGVFLSKVDHKWVNTFGKLIASRIMEFHIIFQNETKMWHENRRECTATFTRTTPGLQLGSPPGGTPWHILWMLRWDIVFNLYFQSSRYYSIWLNTSAMWNEKNLRKYEMTSYNLQMLWRGKTWGWRILMMLKLMITSLIRRHPPTLDGGWFGLSSFNTVPSTFTRGYASKFSREYPDTRKRYIRNTCDPKTSFVLRDSRSSGRVYSSFSPWVFTFYVQHTGLERLLQKWLTIPSILWKGSSVIGC